MSLGSLGFGFLGIFGKLAFASGMSIGQLLTFRFSLATVLLFVFLLLFQKRKLLLPLPMILVSFVLGVLGYAVFSTLYFKSIQGLSVPLAAMLLYTYPFFVGIIQHFIKKESLKLKEWLFLMIVLVGLGLLLFGEFHFQSIWYLVYGISSAIAYAIYIVISAKHLRGVSALGSGMYVMLGASVGLWFFHHPSFEFWKVLSANQYLIILGIAMICTVGPLTLIISGLQKLKETEAAVISTLEPITAAMASVAVLGQIILPHQWFGILLVLFGVVVQGLDKNK